MDLWPYYAKVATAAEGQNAEPGDPVQKMYECVYATTAVCLMALGYPDTEPTDLMNLVHPGGHKGGEDFGVVAAFLRNNPQRWPNLPPIALVNPADTLTYLHSALAAGYAVQMDVKDDRNANVVTQWPAGWQGTHSVIVTGDDGGQIWIWNPWAGDRQHFANAYFQQATLNPAGNFMVFQGDLRVLPQEDVMTIEQAGAIAEMMLLTVDPAMTYQQVQAAPPAGFQNWRNSIAAALMPGSGQDAAQLLAQFRDGLPKPTAVPSFDGSRFALKEHPHSGTVTVEK